MTVEMVFEENMSYETGRLCAGCGELLLIRIGETPLNYNSRTVCDSRCGRKLAIQHGTHSGSEKCAQQPAGPCEICRAKLMLKRRNNFIEARRSALNRLASHHAAEYRELYKEERQKRVSR